MARTRKVRFIEPQTRPGRPFNAWITRWPLLGPVTLGTILHERGYDVAIYNENISGSLLENPDACRDVVVRGEGESLIEALARGEAPRGIIQAPPLEDLDTLPTLRHGLIRDFDRLLARSRRQDLYELPVMTSCGCPHGCTYCSVTRMFGRRVRRQSVDKVCRARPDG